MSYTGYVSRYAMLFQSLLNRITFTTKTFIQVALHARNFVFTQCLGQICATMAEDHHLSSFIRLVRKGLHGGLVEGEGRLKKGRVC